MGHTLGGKVAIVTGASSGIGQAAARLFAEEGAKVVIGARRKEALDALLEEIAANGGEAIAIAGDVKDEKYANALVGSAHHRRACVESFQKFATMSPVERREFLRKAERWQHMSPEERETWRNLVTKLPPMPQEPIEMPPAPQAFLFQGGRMGVTESRELAAVSFE